MHRGRGWAARALVGALTAVVLVAGGGAGPAAAATSVEVDVRVEAPTQGRHSVIYMGRSAPASAEVVHVVLPPSAGGLDPRTEASHANVLGGDGNGVTSEGVTATATGFDLHLPTVLAALGPDLRTVNFTVLLIRGTGPTMLSYDAYVEIALTDEVADEATITLVDDETAIVETRRSWTLPAVTVDDGQDLVLRSSPGFWNDPKADELEVRESWYAPGSGFHREFLSPVISEDGATLTVPIGSTPHDGHELRIMQSFGLAGSRWVYLPIVAPPTQVELYVTSVYQDLFGRDPDPTGLAGWARALERGTPYGAVADGITYSDEFRLGLIADSYQQFLQRDPDTAGLYSWLAAMQQGMHIQQMETGFIASPEYYSRAGGTDPGWLAAVYDDILGRTPTPAEASGWLPVIASKGRIDVARQFLYSTEYLTQVVDGYYQWLLGRSIDPTGARDWVAAIQQGVRSEAIIAGIIASDEYRNNVGR